MTSQLKPSAVIFAKDITRLARFYGEVLEMTPFHQDEDHIVLDAAAIQLVIHGIPTRIAEKIELTAPPQVRENTPIKICLPVKSIEGARLRAAELGGQVGAKNKEWEARGFRACDGHDPEGNVFQVRESAVTRKPIVLPPGQGRAYPMGRISAVFKADEGETNSQYSVSEWFLEPYTQGPGVHSHDEDDLFYVIEGTMSFCVDTEWIDAPRGTFVLVPGGMPHDFQNRSAERAGLLNFSSPGPFEPAMPAIAEWFKAHPPESTR